MSPRFREVLTLQWKASRWGLAPFVLIGFGLPLLALRTARWAAAGAGDFWAGNALVSVLELWNPLFPMVALVLGATVALTAWHWDHKEGHIYALSLPLARWEYVLMKFAAGALLLLIPVSALWAGASLGTWQTPIPEGLNAYPHSFSGRFLLAALLGYATTFALAAGTMRTALTILLGTIAFVMFGPLIVGWTEVLLGVEVPIRPLEILDALLLRWPGPFHVIGGNWSLIDV